MADLPMTRVLASLAERVAAIHDGEPASYIPVLAEADPTWFGVALVTMDGHGYSAGDSEQRFTIQSVSKPFVFGSRSRTTAVDARLSEVGVEPTGQAFNAIVLDEVSTRPPFNPMVNAGEIATADLDPGGLPRARHAAHADWLGRCGRPAVYIDQLVFMSGALTGSSQPRDWAL